MFLRESVILGVLFFVLGFVIANIIFFGYADKDRVKVFKEFDALVERNNELLEENKNLIKFNSELAEKYTHIENMLDEFIKRWNND